MIDEPNEFDDPALKDAIRLDWPTAPAGEMTRARVANLFSQETYGTAGHSGGAGVPQAGRAGRRWMSIAAAVLIGLAVASVGGYYAYEAYEHREYVDANMDRFAELVGIHRGTLPEGSQASDLAVASTLTGIAVATLPADSGWLLQNVVEAPFQGTKVIAADYAKAGRRVTVMSFPAIALIEAEDGFAYTVNAGQGVLTGAVHESTAYCVAGDTEADRELVEAVSRQLVLPTAPTR